MDETNIRARFIKDFKLPITILKNPYYNYFIDLYEPLFNIKEKIDALNETLKKCETQEDFFHKTSKISTQVQSLILNSQSYKIFNECNVDKLFPLKKNVSQQNIYIEPNIDKEMISVDLNKANFNCFKLFNLQDEIKAQTYDELIQKFTNDKYFLMSKQLRQIIFGNLNPARQQRIQRHIIQTLCEKLLVEGCEITSASSDEIIIKNKTNIKEIEEILKDIPEKMNFFRIENFSFSKISEEHDFFIKRTTSKLGNQKLEIKNTPSYFFAQVFKEYFKLPLNEYDLTFYHEGQLAQYKEPIFQQKKLTKKNKKTF